MEWGDWSVRSSGVKICYLRRIPGRDVGFKPELYRMKDGTYEVQDMYHGAHRSSELRTIAKFHSEAAAKTWCEVHYSIHPYGAPKGTFSEPSLGNVLMPSLELGVGAYDVPSISNIKESDKRLLLLLA